jgi:hypothetical protein
MLTVSSITEILIGATRSRISFHLRDIYSICMCCWNGATHQWKVHNGKIYIRERVAPIRISVIEDTVSTEATETRVPVGKGEIITSKMLRSPP